MYVVYYLMIAVVVVVDGELIAVGDVEVVVVVS